MSFETPNTNAWELLREGNPEALHLIYREHYIGLVNYGMKFCNGNNRDLIKECITQMLLDLWNIRERLPQVQHVRAYLITTLRRKILKEIESQKKEEFYTKASSLEEENIEWSYEEYLIKLQNDKMLKERIKTALAKLSNRQKELLQLRFFEDKDYDEIAKQCGITKRTAYNIIYDALALLRKDLGSGDKGFQNFTLPPLVLFSILFDGQF